MIRKQLNLGFQLLLFISISYGSGKIPNLTHQIFSSSHSHNAILSRLRALNFPESHCLQIVIDDDAITDYALHIDDSISYMVRDLTNMLDQNIYDYDIQNLTDFSEHRSITNYYQCNLYLLYPKSHSSLQRMFFRSNKTVFYPHSKIVVIGLGLPRWDRLAAKFIRDNAFYLLFLDEESNQFYSLTRHGLILENTYLVQRSDPSVGPLFENDEKDELRISSYEYAPFVIYVSETECVFVYLN